jgi:hypothetical protein
MKPLHPHERLALALSPDLFAERLFGIKLDPWQRDVCLERRNSILCLGRQSGKTEALVTCATWSLLTSHIARPERPSFVVVIAPSQRQSSEFARRTTAYVETGIQPFGLAFAEKNRLSLTLTSGARLLALPGASSDQVRGLSNVDLLLVDEAAFVDEELLVAVRPFLAVGGGRLVMLSSPSATPVGTFHDTLTSGRDDWARWHRPSWQCSRISEAFLDSELASMSEAQFRREYGAEFVSDIGSVVFTAEEIRAMTVTNVGLRPPPAYDPTEDHDPHDAVLRAFRS